MAATDDEANTGELAKLLQATPIKKDGLFDTSGSLAALKTPLSGNNISTPGENNADFSFGVFDLSQSEG